MSDELVSVPQDLKLLSDSELEELETRATEEFVRLDEADDVTPEALESLANLTTGIERVRAETEARQARYAKEAEQARAKMAEQRESLAKRVGAAKGEGEPTSEAALAAVDADAIAAAAARGATAALIAAIGDNGGNLDKQLKRAATLADAQRHAPPAKVNEGAAVTAPSITAAVDIPGLARNDEMNSMEALANAFYQRARTMSVTNGNPQEQLVASIRNGFEYTVDDRTAPGQIDELIRRLTRRELKESLTAGGGWCAPSDIRYDFFNIAGQVRGVDLPTFGVSRGGIRYPTSPSIADAFGSTGLAPFAVSLTNGSIPWLWTEADDQAAATGASPRKPALRVPCPSFNERRLECYGVTVTAGNLTDDAYPEATSNFLSLVMAAHAHAVNSRILATMTTLSANAVTTGSYAVTGQPAANAILSGVALAAVDYRAKYGMTNESVLEVVMPSWIPDVIQADLAHRRDVEFVAVTEQDIQRWLSARGVRVQFVDDYQVRGGSQFGNASSAMVAWPTQVTFMMYAAGTFLLGNGLQLDLGVTRDSTLNAANDHTAAWSEECHLVAMVGHESRQYTVKFAVAGETAPTSIIGL